MSETARASKSVKIVVWCVVIVAIAIIFFLMAVNGKKSTANAYTPPATVSPTANANATYKDGTYKATADYETPQDTETVSLTVTIKGNTVTDTSIRQSGSIRESQIYQQDFAENYKAKVVGQKVNAIHLSRVSGSSLTSSGFNSALEKIKSEATT